MVGWFPCAECCGEEYLCDKCSGTTPETITVTFASVADAACSDCDDIFNDTHVLTNDHAPIPQDCRWVKNGTFCSGTGYQISALAQTIGGVYEGWRIVVYFDAPGVSDVIEFEWDSGSFDAFDCTAQRTATLTVDSGTNCSGTSATCQVN